MKTFSGWLLGWAVLLPLVQTGDAVGAAVYRLGADWSDTQNPNGVWAYQQGTNPLPHVASWPLDSLGGTQGGWASGGTVPFWFRAATTPPSSYDWLPGDIVVHTQDDASGGGRGPATVTWTSPFDGWVDVTGGVWMPKAIERANQWKIYVRDTLLTTGNVSSGDSYSRSRPFDYAEGSGGPSVLQGIAVATGDVIALELTRTSTYGDYVGVNLIVTQRDTPPPPAPGVVVYENNFESGAGAAWSATTIATSPRTKRKFLGEFGAQTVTLSLSNLPPHTAVAVEFDLLILRSWDGDTPGVGPDIWGLQVAGGPTLLRTTFAGDQSASPGIGQSFPGNYGARHFPRLTGATEVNSMGYELSPYGAMDSVYHLRYVFPHGDTNRLALQFYGSNLEALGNESWGLDNLRIRVWDVAAGVLAVLPPAGPVAEGDGFVDVNVRRIGGSAGSLTVNYATAPETAVEGVDYTPSHGTLTFADGETNQVIRVGLLDNNLAENDRTFRVVLDTPSAGTLLPWIDQEIRILDDDGHFEFVSASQSQNEFTTDNYLSVVWKGAANRATSVGYTNLSLTATVGKDLEAVGGGAWVCFFPGERNKTFFFRTIEDTLVEEDEQALFRLVSPAPPAGLGTRSNLVFTILDNDRSSGPGPGANWDVLGLTPQPDGKVLVAGGFLALNGVARGIVGRLNSDGSLDTTFGAADSGWGDTCLVQPDGKVVVVGSFGSIRGTTRNSIARLNTNGTLDVTFTTGSGANNWVETAALQSNGKIVVGGWFTTINGIAQSRVARVGGNGSLDAAFANAGGPNGTVRAVAIHPVGGQEYVLIGGDFTQVGGTSAARMARLNPAGGLDTAFNPGGAGADGSVMALAVQPDGKIILAGTFTHYNGAARTRVARLNADGTLDTTFNAGQLANATLNAVALQPDGKILLGGNPGNARLVRLNANGTQDSTFHSPVTTDNGAIHCIAVLPDGRIVVGDHFTAIGAETRARIAFLAADGTLLPGPTAAMPVVRVQPESPAGSTPSWRLRVIAEGAAPLSYQWRRDGIPIPGATDAALSLNTSSPPVLRWSFNGSATDSIRGLGLTTAGGASLANGRLVLGGGGATAFSDPLPFSLRDLTLEAWCTIQNPASQNDILGIENPDILPNHEFDAIVLGEMYARRWIAGSDFWRRTRYLNGPQEPTLPSQLVHLAITYGNSRTAVYRNGVPYGDPYATVEQYGGPREYRAGVARLLFGHRVSDTGAGGFMNGTIEEVRVYDRSLSPGEVGASFAAGPDTLWSTQRPASAGDNGLYDVVISNAAGAVTSRVAAVTFNATPGTLEQGFDQPSLVFDPSGGRAWGYTTVTTHDGVDAVQSHLVLPGDQSLLKTRVSGPAVMTFRYRITSPTHASVLRLEVDGTPVFQTSSSGDDWRYWTGAVGAGAHDVAWRFLDPLGLGNGAEWVYLDELVLETEGTPVPGLDGVMQAAGTVWSRVGPGTWSPVPDPEGTGAVVLGSDPLGPDESAWVQTAVDGPARVAFRWKVSSLKQDARLAAGQDAEADSLAVYLDATELGSISGKMPWGDQSIYVPAGQHWIRFAYRHLGSRASGFDAGWIRSFEVDRSVDAARPRINREPEDQVIAAGGSSLLSVTASGAAPLRYQWWRNGTALPQATNPVLRVSAAGPGQSGDYWATVSNTTGLVRSRTASLQVAAGTSPAEIARFDLDVNALDSHGRSPAGDVDGARFDGGAMRLNGLFEYRVSPSLPEPFRARFSIPELRYESFALQLDFNPTSPADGPVVTGGTGSRWFGLRTVGGRLALVLNGGDPVVVFSKGLVTPGNWNTVVCSVDVAARRVLTRLNGQDLEDTALPAGFVSVTTSPGNPPGLSEASFAFTDYATGEAFQGAVRRLRVFGRALTDDELSAATRPAGVPLLWVNGVAVTGNAVTTAGPATVALAADLDGSTLLFTLDGADPTLGRAYTGPFVLSDSATLKAITYSPDFANEREVGPVQIHVTGPPWITVPPAGGRILAGQPTNLRVEGAGPGEIQYQWYLNGTRIGGATTGELALGASQTRVSGDYTVELRNAFGSVTSAVARLEVLLRPGLAHPVAGQSASPGNDITLCAEATGTEPLRFQWRRNGLNLPGATNACLLLPAVQAADGGSYSVVVANETGTLTSDPALVRVTVPVVASGDLFADRVLLASDRGSVAGSNVLATAEAGEPLHAGKPGGKSVWYRWVPSRGGIATFDTRGSSFDTLLAVYQGATLPALQAMASDEDSGGYYTSALQVPVQAGQEYAIAVDGYAGAAGDIVLTWALEPTADPFPRLVTAPVSVAAAAGGDATFTAVAVPDGVAYQWFFQGTPIPGATASTLQVSPVRADRVGAYTVQVTAGPGRIVTSAPVNLELGPESTVVTYDKLQDLLNAPPPAVPSLAGGGASDGYIAIRLGSQGSQVLNNLNSGTQAGEPNHCNLLASGRTRWFGLRVTTNGVVSLDTLASSIDTVLAVYRWVADIRQVSANLVACDIDPTAFASQVAFEVTDAPRDFLIAVDSVGPALTLPRGDGSTETGLIHLNWAMGLKPVLQSVTGGGLVVAGESRLLSVVGQGAGLHYRWTYNGQEIPGAIQSQWTVPSIEPSQAGDYGVEVSNLFGAVQGGVRLDVVQSPPRSWTVESGDTARLGVVVVPADPACVPQYEWYRNGQRLAGATGPLMRVAGTDLQSAGSYQVLVTTCGASSLVDAGSLAVRARVALVTGPLQGLGEFRFPPVSDPVCAVILESLSTLDPGRSGWIPVMTNRAPGTPLQLSLPPDYLLEPGLLFRARLQTCPF